MGQNDRIHAAYDRFGRYLLPRPGAGPLACDSDQRPEHPQLVSLATVALIGAGLVLSGSVGSLLAAIVAVLSLASAWRRISSHHGRYSCPGRA